MKGQAFQFPVLAFNGGFPWRSTEPSSAYSFGAWLNKIKKKKKKKLIWFLHFQYWNTCSEFQTDTWKMIAQKISQQTRKIKVKSKLGEHRNLRRKEFKKLHRFDQTCEIKPCSMRGASSSSMEPIVFPCFDQKDSLILMNLFTLLSIGRRVIQFFLFYFPGDFYQLEKILNRSIELIIIN